MTFFQFALIAGVVIAGIFAVRVLPGERSLALKRIFALLFVIAAVLAILFPNALTSIANVLGIGRGTDLLLYVFVVMAMLFAVATVRAKARSDSRVTELARAVALIEARNRERAELTERGDDASSGSDSTER